MCNNKGISIQVIVADNHDLMDVDIAVSTAGVSATAVDRVFRLEAYYLSQLKWPPWEAAGVARVISSDRVMLRNPRIDL